MSAEDETFDIDLYGDEEEETQQYDAPAAAGAAEPVTYSSLDGASDLPGDTLSNNNTITKTAEVTVQQPTATSNTQSLKRKAPDDENEKDEPYHDERPLDQGAQVSLKLTELQWWTTEEDLRYFCAQSHTEAELVDLSFAEHKSNGKSKGEAYLEFKTPQAAGMVKRQIEKANAELEGKPDVNKTRISVWYTTPGNPYKSRDGQSKKDVGGKPGQQAYNNYNQNRGGYAPRGRGGYNARGGNWSNQNTSNNYNNNSMMGGYGNMGFGGWPQAMNQNPMMNMMGFNMGAMGMAMAGRGGANMMNRGGWNGQGNYQQGGYAAGWDSNKKSRNE